MGCKHSVPAAVADEAGPESAASSPGGREAARRSNQRGESLQNKNQDDGSSLDVLSSSSETTFAKDYRIIRHVGGELSRIFLVVRNHHEDHQASAPQHQQHDDGVMDAYVMQVIDMKAVAPERREAMKEEIQSLKKISHPNILKICDVYDNIDRNNTISMVTELCTGQDLASFATRPCGEDRTRSIVTQILVAVNYMHKRGLFHHQLSLENILFQDDTNEVIKITYVGLRASSSYNSANAYLSGSRNRGDKDIYSIGSIAYQLLSGGIEPPTSVDSFCEEDDGRDLEGESSGHHRQNLFLSHIWRNIQVSRAAKNFIESGMQHGFVTVEQALQHRWITQTSIYMQGTSTSSTASPSIASNDKDITEAQECDPTADETSFTEEESVGPPETPKDLALPVLAAVSPHDKDTAGAHDERDPASVDESSSSDEESMGVPLPPEESLVPVLADNVPAPTGAEGPKTPTQHQKTSAVAAHQAESPSQTPSDFADLHEVFHQVSDDEGEVTIEKLRIGLRSKYTEEEVNAWFKSGKFDDSRNVKYKEFLAEAIRSRRKIERLRVQEAFQKIDKGKQGFVTVGNLRAVLGTDNSEYIEQMIKAANTKRDNKITYEKFKEVLESSNRTEI